jgi:superfamily II DNA or RNA helicase
MSFRWPWRDYQERLLAVLPALLRDRRLHVVAAPGSGKTVLGLEVFRRLGQPTVVLSPTRTIRDQWLARLGDFLPEHDVSELDWLGRDLGDLRFFTSLTYQALHTRIRGRQATPADDLETAAGAELDEEENGAGPSKGEVAEVVARLRAAGIRVLILDEAHHLRAEWWAAISEIVTQLGDVTLVSLTGTPPYDVLGHEWSRYIELCGPIDEEISIPELVKAGTLCPHEDYVWLEPASPLEEAKLRSHREAVGGVCVELLADETFRAEVSVHPWVLQPQQHALKIMDSPDTAMALVGYLRARGVPVTALMGLLDVADEDLPAFDPRQWELLLHEYLFGEAWPAGPDAARRRALGQRLRQDGLLWRRELSLVGAGRHWPQLNQSTSKVEACLRIHELESGARGADLRQVILTDYIRDEDYLNPAPRSALGAWPVFHRLATAYGVADSFGSPARPGVGEPSGLVLHTGRLTVVHQDLIPLLEQEAGTRVLQSRPVPALDGYREVSSAGSQRLTGLLTRLLARGHIRVLVGTRALLGEGWDAPVVNSLVLASMVGSFMTTNQMRGRAIRTDPDRPDKVASIWHLGTFADLGREGWDLRDLEDMARRFETFVGLAEYEPAITGGLNRMDVRFYAEGRCRTPIRAEAHNAAMAARLRERMARAERWHRALDESEIGRTVPAVRVPTLPRFAPLAFAGTIRALVLRLLTVALVGLSLAAEFHVRAGHRFAWPHLALLTGAGLTIFLLPRTIRLGILFVRFLPVDGAVRAIGKAVLDALCESGLLPVNLGQAKVIARQDGQGVFHLALAAGTFAERSLFADCLYQVLSPVEKPRYLITRKQNRLALNQVDYHAVPAVLGVRAERAQEFLRAWQAHVGPGDLIYTRSEDGRRALIRAQARAYANAADQLTKRLDRWF